MTNWQIQALKEVEVVTDLTDAIEQLEGLSPNLQEVIEAAKKWRDLQSVLNSMSVWKALGISRAHFKRIGMGQHEGRALQCLIRVTEASLSNGKATAEGVEIKEPTTINSITRRMVGDEQSFTADDVYWELKTSSFPSYQFVRSSVNKLFRNGKFPDYKARFSFPGMLRYELNFNGNTLDGKDLEDTWEPKPYTRTCPSNRYEFQHVWDYPSSRAAEKREVERSVCRLCDCRISDPDLADIKCQVEDD